MIHVAILLRPYLDLVLDGRKSMESRLTRTARRPFHAIAPGERIYFKQSSGPFRATAVAGRVRFFDDLTPMKIRQLHREFNRRIRGDAEFWRRKSNSRFATLIELESIEAIRSGPCVQPQRGVAWLTLPQERDVYPACVDGDDFASLASIIVPLTAGAIRRRYLNVRGALDRFPTDALGGPTRDEAGRSITIRIPRGPAITTDIVESRGILRSRRWGEWFECEQARPGDAVILQQTGPRSYRASLIRSA